MRGLGVHLILNPAGTYSFKGTIPVQLAWINKDGTELTNEQAAEVARANYPAMLAKTRVFQHPEDALEAAKKYKIGITSIDNVAEAELAAQGLLDEKDYGDRG